MIDFVLKYFQWSNNAFKLMHSETSIYIDENINILQEAFLNPDKQIKIECVSDSVDYIEKHLQSDTAQYFADSMCDVVAGKNLEQYIVDLFTSCPHLITCGTDKLVRNYNFSFKDDCVVKQFNDTMIVITPHPYSQRFTLQQINVLHSYTKVEFHIGNNDIGLIERLKKLSHIKILSVKETDIIILAYLCDWYSIQKEIMK